jgi:hypothetical protein
MKNQHRRWAFLSLAFVLVLASACSKPRSSGPSFDLTVLADSSDWNQVGSLVEELVASSWISPQPEGLWNIVMADPVDLQAYLTRQNLLILSCSSEEGSVHRFLQNLLPAEVQDRIHSEEAFAFLKQDAFAREQQFLILAAPTVASFERQLKSHQKDLQASLLQYAYDRQTERLFARLEQPQLADSLLALAGAAFRVPPDWFIEQYKPKEQFMRFRRFYPDRWITVQWVDGDDSLRQSESGLREVRRRLGRSYWDKVYDEVGFGRFSLEAPERLMGESCSKLEGLWGTDERLGGGPFLLWAVYDPDMGDAGRTFYIDAAVLSPGAAKSPWLHQLTCIARTFFKSAANATTKN